MLSVRGFIVSLLFSFLLLTVLSCEDSPQKYSRLRLPTEEQIREKYKEKDKETPVQEVPEMVEESHE